MSPGGFRDDEVPSFEPIRKRPRPVRDTLATTDQHSNYFFSDHGPEPVPEWVITDDAALQFERGILKTGKEADVHLVERTLGERVNLLAAKRYRSFEHRDFQNDAPYRERLRTGNRRVDLAIAQGSKQGRQFRAQLWADHEFAVLGRLWTHGVAVPYPVQQRGTELMLEYIGDEEGPAPRLTDFRADPALLEELCRQALEALEAFADLRIVHGDLSPYNVLVWEDRLVFIDFPQAVHAQDADGATYLTRDVATLLGWFVRQGVAVDPDAELARVLGRVFG